MAETDKPEAAETAEPRSFEENLESLEKAVAQLEEGNLSLDDSLSVYEDGIRAYRSCREALEKAETKVRKLVETMEGELGEEPFDAPEQ